MNKLSLKMKFALGFGIALLLLLILACTSYVSIEKLGDATAVVEANVLKADLTTGMDASIAKQTSGVRGYLISGNEDLLKQFEEGKEEFKGHADKLREMLVTEKGKKLMASLTQSEDTLLTYQTRAVQLQRAGKSKEAANTIFSPENNAVKAALQRDITTLIELEDQLKNDAIKEQASISARTETLVVSLSLAGLLIGIVSAVFITRSITGAISRMLTLIQEVAGNNLAIEDMEIRSEDEIGQAGVALNKMKNSLREVVQSIAGTAEHVASASEEISSSATLQSQGAETQKDQTAQVATAMQEMSSTVLQVSENSGKAAEASRKAAETARQGGTIVEETLNKMRTIAESVSNTAKKVEELGKSSDQIGRIIGVIDDIADQTNLLALNAAIEAARAGEQGRGFAVVADEVRKLAERTTSATKEIAQMIQTVQSETKVAVAAMEEGNRQVEEGVKTTAQAGDSLKEIIHMSENVGEMITHIATAATEQSSATEEINNNMEQIAKLVKESAEGAKQSAQACSDLSGLALDLQKLVGNFRLGDKTDRVRRSATSNSGRTKASAASAGGY